MTSFIKYLHQPGFREGMICCWFHYSPLCFVTANRRGMGLTRSVSSRKLFTLGCVGRVEWAGIASPWTFMHLEKLALV